MARRRSTVSRAAVADRPAPLDPPVSRREWVAVAALVLLAAGLRFAFPGRMAVEHFDEGVYASNIFFTAEEGGQYPYRHLYAPPLLPFLIEWGIIFLGPESIAPFLPALLLGTATVPLAWWAARCWFGPAAGLAAGLLVATSDFHLLYSRTALTDVPVAFFLLLAVYLFWEAVRRESLGWAVAAGLATGLAWWTKYTGWLPLAIAASGAAAWVLFERRAGGVSPLVRAKLVTKLFAAMTLTAFAAWSPVLWGLQQYGGYAAVAENHRGYLQPPSKWGINAWEQAGNLGAQSGILTASTLAALAAAVVLIRARPSASRLLIAAWCGLTAGWTCFEIGPAVPLLLLATMGLAFELHPSFRPPPTGPVEAPVRSLAGWLVAAWFVGMLATTPAYHPYPRLAMPWLLAALTATAALVGGLPRIENANPAARRGLAYLAAMLLLPAAVLAGKQHPAEWFTGRWNVPAWQDRTSLRREAQRVVALLDENRPRGEPTVVYVYDRTAGPAIFFHVAAVPRSEVAVVPAGDLSFALRPPKTAAAFAVTTFPEVIDPSARPVPADKAAALAKLRLIQSEGTNLVRPSSLLLLDGERPAGDPHLKASLTNPEPDFHPWYALELLRVVP